MKQIPISGQRMYSFISGLYSLAFIIFSGNLFASNLMSLPNALQQAKIEQKNIFVQYESAWCVQCAILNDSVLANPFIRSVIQQEYISVVANISDTESRDWYEKYKVTCLPTLQIIDINGHLLVELNAANEEELYSHLLDHTIPRELNTSIVESKSSEIGTNDIQEYSVIPENAIPIPQPTEPLAFAVNNNEEVAFILKTQIKKEYTVTVGAFYIRNNAIKYQQSIANHNLVTEIFIEEDPAKQLYRVNAGRFPTYDSGQSVIKAFREKNITCYLRSL